MYDEKTVVECITKLQQVSNEATVVLRKAKLQTILLSSKDEDLSLLNLVLSFQMVGMFSPPVVRFNNLPFENFNKHVRDWIRTGDRTVIPYVMQSILYYMASTSSIHLGIQHVAACKFKYVVPHEWVARNLEHFQAPKEVSVCSLCNEPLHTGESICLKCKEALERFTEFRGESFMLDLNYDTCDWIVPPKENCGDFSYRNDTFRITRTSANTVSFELVQRPYQLQIPFEEYQRNIS